MKSFEAIVKLRHSAHGHETRRRMDVTAEDRDAAATVVHATACAGGYAGYRLVSILEMNEV